MCKFELLIVSLYFQVELDETQSTYEYDVNDNQLDGSRKAQYPNQGNLTVRSFVDNLYLFFLGRRRQESPGKVSSHYLSLETRTIQFQRSPNKCYDPKEDDTCPAEQSHNATYLQEKQRTADQDEKIVDEFIVCES